MFEFQNRQKFSKFAWRLLNFIKHKIFIKRNNFWKSEYQKKERY